MLSLQEGLPWALAIALRKVALLLWAVGCVVLCGAGLGVVGLAHSFWLVALTCALAALGGGGRWVRGACTAPESTALPTSLPITIKEVRS